MEFLAACLNLAAALMVVNRDGVDAQSKVLNAYIKDGECAILPAQRFRSSVVPNSLHRLIEVNDMVVFSGTFAIEGRKPVEFWSWTDKGGSMDQALKGKAM